MGRFGSLRPERARRMLRATALMASSWEMTRLWSSFSSSRRRWASFFSRRVERDAGHLADDFGDHFFIDDAIDFLGLLAPGALCFFFLLAKGFGLVAQLGGTLVVGVLDGFIFLNGEPFDLLFDFSEIGRLGHALQAHASAGFVDHVDGLVGQATAGDVAGG